MQPGPTMVKMITLFRRPADPGEFDRRFFGVHLPLLKAVPGIGKIEVVRIVHSPIGEPGYHLMTEAYFATRDAMDAANASPEGRAAALDMLALSPDPVILFGEIS